MARFRNLLVHLYRTIVHERVFNNLPPRRQLVRYANEATEEREGVYGVEVTVCGRTGVFEAVIEPAKRYGLLGSIEMETLDLIADPRSQRLYVNPRSPDLPMAAKGFSKW